MKENNIADRKPYTASSQPKFRAIKIQQNELQSKYDIYKNGTPNIYEQSLDTLKIHHLKNELNIMQLPAIDYVLKQMKNSQKDITANKRDYRIHPSLTQKYANKFKDLVSDKQQINDFIKWFRSKDQQISSKQVSVSKKFHLLQNLIGSGFNEIITQLSNISRPRSDLLKMLWNRQVSQAEKIIQIVHKQSTQNQKKNLEVIKSLHIDYQDQLIHLKTDNYCMQKKLEEASVLNQSCINTLRVMRKQIKKYQCMIKQLQQANLTLKNQSLNLLQQNTKFMIREKNISAQHARILSYRVMQIGACRKNLKKGPKAKEYFRDIKDKAEQAVDEFNLPDMEDRKQKLVKFIKKRLNQYPQQKIFILKQEFQDEDDDVLSMDVKLEQLVKAKQVREQLSVKSILNFSQYFIETGMNTDIPEQKCQVSINKIQAKDQKQIQTEWSHFDQTTHPNYNLQKLLQAQQNEQQVQILMKKINERNSRKRNSLLFLQMNKNIQFRKIDSMAKMRRVSKFNNVTSIANTPKQQSTDRDINDQKHIDPISIKIGIETPKDQNLSNQLLTVNSIKKPISIHSITQNHRNSFIGRKSIDFQKMILSLNEEVEKQEEPEELQRKSVAETNNIERKSAPVKINEVRDKIQQFRTAIKKYMEQYQNKSKFNMNPQKHLKKILTNAFKSVSVSGKYNLLAQLVNVAKNCYGNIAFQGRLFHFIAMMLQNKEQKSLLSAVGLLLRIDGYNSEYKEVNCEDINEVYFKFYLNLSLKHPSQNKFNIWNNYTNINKINHPSFTNLLKQYFSQSKCTYLNMKIKQFVGIDSNQQVDGNYFVKLNPLMMYLLEVYLVEKKNYYESYHQLINFLANGEDLNLQTFVFLLDLLCFEEQEQSKIVMNYFSVKDKDHRQKKILTCNKDCFYRVCIKYELPLFQFMRILKTEQFKSLSEENQKKFGQLSNNEKWDSLKVEISQKLKQKEQKMSISYFMRLINRLDIWIKQGRTIQKDAFTFIYRLILQTAYMDTQQ